MSEEPALKGRWDGPLAVSRVLATAGLLTAFFFLFGLTPRRLADAVADADATDLTLAAIVMAALLVLLVLKWYLIARWLDIATGAAAAARLYLMGTVLNTLLPTAVGGDLYRVYMLSRQSGSPFGRSLLSVVLERVTGYGGLIILSGGGAAFYFLGTLAGVAISVAIAGTVAAACWWFEVARRSGQPAAEASRWHWRRLLSIAPNLHLTVLLSLPQQALWITSAALLGRAYGASLPWSYWAVAVTATTLLTLLPVSVGGLGVREVGYAALLSAVDVEASRAAAVSLAMGFGPSLLSLAGLPLLAVAGLRSRPASSASVARGEPPAPGQRLIDGR